MNKVYDIITNTMHLSPIKTGSISDHLYAIKTGTVNFFIYKDNEDIICIDTGFDKILIIRELKSVGIDPRSITHLFLTHSDFNHADGLVLFEKAKVYLSSDEEHMFTSHIQHTTVIRKSSTKQLVVGNNQVYPSPRPTISAISRLSFEHSGSR